MLGPNVVLPPLGPLFAHQSAPIATAAAAITAAATAISSGSTTGTATTTGSETPPLRTPTSVHAYLSGGAFPSSSPIRKDDAASAGRFTPEKKKQKKTTTTTISTTKKSHTTANMLLLSLDAPSAPASSSSSMAPHHHHHDDGSASPTCEDEKLRLSRERNRLHAQRTRIRKRELLESLKERIHALQREHGLLRQAFEFHATAVSLLSLGCGAGDDPSIRHLEDVSDAALELFESTTALHHAYLDDDDDDALLLLDECAGSTAGRLAHDKGCDCYDDDGNDSDHADSSACSCSAGTTADASSDLVNSNGKRLHASALGGSKEEREQLRRERNRLHARRARLRKKLILERSQQAVQELRKRNEYLRERLAMLITSIYGAGAAAAAAATGSCPP